MIISLTLNIVGSVLFLFLLWKKLREDYPSNQIFTIGLYSLIGLFVFNFATRKLFPSWWFFGSFAGSLVGLGIGIAIYKMKFYETFEAYVASILPLTSFMFLFDSVWARSIASFLSFVFIVVLMGGFFLLDKHYKKFTWYKSGRIGFTGLSIVGAFFLIRSAVASFFPYVISFVGKLEVVISGIIAFAFFLLLFNLARQKA